MVLFVAILNKYLVIARRARRKNFRWWGAKILRGGESKVLGRVGQALMGGYNHLMGGVPHIEEPCPAYGWSPHVYLAPAGALWIIGSP